MSRPQHRKSQSTSALSIIASSPSRPTRPPRERSRGGLDRVDEGPSPYRRGSEDSSRGSHNSLEHGAEASERARGKERAENGGPVTAGDVRGWMNDVLSIRSSPSKRVAALQHLEECLLRCCLGGHTDSTDMIEFLSLGREFCSMPPPMARLADSTVHTNLLILLTRHAQLLASRAQSHSSLHATDEVAIALVPEITAVFGLLQGLCLLSSSCKAACAEEWTIEMLIDLLLLLRAIPASAAGTDDQTSRPVVYSILELLFCMLVDSPEYSRRFERLSGLEAVTRVLKGSSVSKEVRMKCIEFLYFYLLPEHQSRSLSASSNSNRSTSTSTSNSSSDSLYPPSPLDRSSLPRQSPLIVHAPRSPKRSDDLDLNFVPQTPRKKVTPNLGYLTPSSRRTSGSHSSKSTPALQTVPASPLESGASTPRASAPRRESGDAEVGLGLGLPNAKGGGMKRDVTAIHLGALVASPESSSASRSRESAQSRAPRSPASGQMSRSSTQPNISGLPSSQRQTSLSIRKTSRSPLVQSSIPESPKPEEGVLARRRQSRSSLYPTSDTDGASGASDSGLVPRMRHSRTSSQLSAHAESLSSPLPPIPRAPRIRHSMTSTNLSSSVSAAPPPTLLPPKSPGMRHSRTSSHLSALAPDVPAMVRSPSAFLAPTRTPSAGERDRTSSSFLAPTPSHSRIPSGGNGGMDRTPSKARRAFPSDLTRGMLPPPSVSSPKPTPLGHSRRLSSTSERRSSLAPKTASGKSDVKEMQESVRSVEEKKELLGQWLGNVDALVSGVEGAGWWGAQGKGR